METKLENGGDSFVRRLGKYRIGSRRLGKVFHVESVSRQRVGLERDRLSGYDESPAESLHSPTSGFQQMVFRSHFPLPLGWLLFVLAAGIGPVEHLCSAAETPETISPEDEAFFESKIRPLLIEHCYECHSRESGEISGELALDSGPAMLRGGASGPALVPGEVERSLIIRAVRYEDSAYQMPPTEKLPAESIEALERWVQRGAADPRTEDTPTSLATEKRPAIAADEHWAYQTPKPYAGPIERRDADVDRIDSIARKIAADSGLSPAPPASDRVWIKRLYFDLTGLPPRLDQIDSFARSTDPRKRDKAIDRLLASPAFAERFARHWMDVARYADTVGYALGGRPRELEGSDRYRDWLIRAFASDLPYDQMIRYQLAADHFDPDNQDGHWDAMGFITVGRRFLNRFDTIDDRIDVVTRGLIGMTVACARCHDHKFDPIPTADYYSLLGIFQSSREAKDLHSPLALVDKDKPSDSQIFLRGQPGNRGDVAPRQYLTALRDSDDKPFRDGSGRKHLALKLSSSDNPLTARVFVNRVWMHLIGVPIIDSTSDFGVRTEPTALTPILDELAVDFSRDWSVKRLVQRIVRSRIYAQSSIPSQSEALTIDPENRYAARGQRRRRDFESLRDSLLMTSGHLDCRIGGPSVEIHLKSPVPRRTLYAKIDRQNLPSLFRTFDFASPDAHTPKRLATTVPQQALFLLNHPQVGRLANSVADRIRWQNSTPSQQVNQLFQQILQRAPTADESEHCVTFLMSPATEQNSQFDPRRAWRYGTTAVNDQSRVDDFQAFKVFNGSTWQDTDELPAKTELAYASLGSENGHPGPKHAVVRRWVAPAGGRVRISGMVGHRNEKGDGVELAVWIGESRVWRESQKSNNRPFRNISGRVAAGEFVDFVVSPQQSDSFDSFFLRCQVRLETADGSLFEGDSVRDFAGPIDEDEPIALDRLAQLAHTLLLSNEFAFVD